MMNLPSHNLFIRDRLLPLRERLWSSGYDMGFPSYNPGSILDAMFTDVYLIGFLCLNLERG
jgi:hypothetical protein